jgi:hypothetical protein
MRTLHIRLTILMLLFLVVACSSAPEVGNSKHNPSSDYALTNSSDFNDAKILPLSSKSNVLIPDTDKEIQGEKTPAIYSAFLCIWADAEHLYEIAGKFERGEMNDLNGYNALLLLATLVRRMELEHKNVEVPTSLAQLWERVQEVHRITRGVIIRWGYNEIKAAQVMREMEPELFTIREVLTSTEEILVNEWDVSPSELTGERERLLEIYSSIYIPIPITSHED